MGCCFSTDKLTIENTNHSKPLIDNTISNKLPIPTKHPEFLDQQSLKDFCNNNYPHLQKLYKKYGHPRKIISNLKNYKTHNNDELMLFYKYYHTIYRVFVWDDLVAYSTMFDDHSELVFFTYILNESNNYNYDSIYRNL